MRLLCLVLLFACTSAAAEAPPRDSSLGGRIVQAVSYGDRLYLTGAEGQLVTFVLPTGRRDVLYESGVAAITAGPQGVWALLGGPKQQTVSIARLDTADASTPERLPDEIGDPVGILVHGTSPYVVGTKGLAAWDGRAWKLVAFETPLEGFYNSTVRMTADGRTLYVGDNRGEWGGELSWIDTATGRRQELAFKTALCDGLYNPDCDPITAIIQHPQRPQCVLAAVGISHMLTDGRILEVCRDEVRILFERKVPAPEKQDVLACDICFWPMFGLAASSTGEVWAASQGMLFRLDGDEVQEVPMPEPTDWHGIAMSRLDGGLLLIWTDVSAAVSLSGYTPLLVPTQ